MAFVAFVAMTVALSADVIGREVFSEGVFGAVRFSLFALILCAMAGFGLATANGAHLRPRFLDFLTERTLRRPAARAGNLLSAIILGTFVYAAWKMVSFSLVIGETDLMLGIPMWPIQMAIPVGFGLSAIRYLIYALYPDLAPEEGVLAE
ncbi:MAG: TRAP transporter small permease [Notoacmeibacter sp.]|nr:TRAP transporter small permease [Notoacmeibacter sp.]